MIDNVPSFEQNYEMEYSESLKDLNEQLERIDEHLVLNERHNYDHCENHSVEQSISDLEGQFTFLAEKGGCTPWKGVTDPKEPTDRANDIGGSVAALTMSGLKDAWKFTERNMYEMASENIAFNNQTSSDLQFHKDND